MIRSIDVNKVHGHNDISIRMIKICDNSLVRSLSLLFEKSFDSSYFNELQKKSNIIPVHKKMTNEILKINTLLPIFSKTFEKIIFNSLYTFLHNEKLLNSNQSGFRPSDSCINQLLSTRSKFSSLLVPHCHQKLEQFFRYIKGF